MTVNAAMSEVNHRLNDLVVEIGRSFLQYVGENSPWTLTKDAERRQVLTGLVKQQSQSVARLVELLDSDGHTIEFGSYPTEYTDKQFLSLDYLQRDMLENQKGVVDLLRSTRDGVECEDLAAQLDAILESETQVLASLESLAKK